MKTDYIHQSRQDIIWPEFQKPYFLDIANFLKNEKKSWKITFPDDNNIFRAFELTDRNNLSVVILGQDPYHDWWQAHWLCFSVPDGVTAPPSLANIFKEMHRDLNIDQKNITKKTDLTYLARQWVLLLNCILTVEAHTPLSHKDIWRQKFTDFVISSISQQKSDIVFLLRWWFARSKIDLIDTGKHQILESSHPSPLSVYRWFSWCGHFTRTNEFLKSKNKAEIQWM